MFGNSHIPSHNPSEKLDGALITGNFVEDLYKPIYIGRYVYNGVF